MIAGTINADLEPILEVVLLAADGQEYRRNAVVDTGYTGWLTMPPDTIAELGLAWRERGGATLADGSRTLFDVYNATIIWDGHPLTIPVDAVDEEPLLGMSLMYDYELLMPVREEKSFTLRNLLEA